MHWSLAGVFGWCLWFGREGVKVSMDGKALIWVCFTFLFTGHIGVFCVEIWFVVRESR